MDATEAFEAAGHSDEARKMVEQYYVGEYREVLCVCVCVLYYYKYFKIVSCVLFLLDS